MAGQSRNWMGLRSLPHPRGMANVAADDDGLIPAGFNILVSHWPVKHCSQTNNQFMNRDIGPKSNLSDHRF